MGIFTGLFHTQDKPTNSTSGSAFSFFLGGSSSGKMQAVKYFLHDGGEDIFLDSIRRRECIHTKIGRKPLNFT